MNEFIIKIGENQEQGFYAMFANDNLIVDGDTPEEAFINLLRKGRYPTIWAHNLFIKDNSSLVDITDKVKCIIPLESQTFDGQFYTKIDIPYSFDKKVK